MLNTSFLWHDMCYDVLFRCSWYSATEEKESIRHMNMMFKGFLIPLSLSLSPCPNMLFVAVSPLLSLKVATGHAHTVASSTMNLQVRSSASKNCACSFKDCQPWHWTPHHWGFSKQNKLTYHQSEVCSKRESLQIICWSFTFFYEKYVWKLFPIHCVDLDVFVEDLDSEKSPVYDSHFV